MTSPKAVYRKRRKSSISGIPKSIREWFAGERRFTFYAYTYPYRAHMREYWAAWTEENPNAVMPPGLQDLLETPAYPLHFNEEHDED